MKENDTIICHDKKDAKRCGDNVGWKNIEDWEFFPDGTVKMYLNCTIEDLLKEKMQ